MACLQFLLVMALAALCRVGKSSSDLIVPEACKDEMFCNEKPEFYDKYQHDISEKFRPIKELWNLEEEAEDPSVEEGLFTFESNCSYQKKVITPYLVKNNGTTKIIVQTNFYKQKFMTTECFSTDSSSTEGDKCFQELTTTSEGHCRTKYTSIVLYVYNNEKSKIERVPVDIPVCCICSIQ